MVEVVVPTPALKNIINYWLHFILFNFSLQKPYKTYVLLMQEDFNIFLLIGTVKAPSVLVLMASFPSCSSNSSKEFWAVGICVGCSLLPISFAATLFFTIIKPSSSIWWGCNGSWVSCVLTCLYFVLTCVFFLHSFTLCPNILQLSLIHIWRCRRRG